LDEPVPEAQLDINISVGSEMLKLLAEGGLPDMGREITCPVLAIQGVEDLRCPVDKIKDPLSRVIKDLELLTLEKCGHYPWFEKQAKDHFFSILFEKLKINLNAE
jgi:pimeloyl-ACP methyl ester carboxylesterase